MAGVGYNGQGGTVVLAGQARGQPRTMDRPRLMSPEILRQTGWHPVFRPVRRSRSPQNRMVAPRIGPLIPIVW